MEKTTRPLLSIETVKVTMNEHTNLTDSIPADLPMSVPLKGHENYFNEFSMEATEVMELLGIKRSRLRQISGQELRVGRKRVERYIKPFYRPEDVESYQQWTRQTMSHKKSSDALQSAAKELSDMKSNIASVVSQDIIRESVRLNKSISDSVRSEKEARSRLLLELDRGLADQAQSINQFKNKINEKIAKLQKLLETSNNHLNRVLQTTEILKELSLEGSGLSTQNGLDIRQQGLRVESLEGQIQHLCEQSVKTQEQLTTLTGPGDKITTGVRPGQKRNPALIKRKIYLAKKISPFSNPPRSKPRRPRTSAVSRNPF